MPITLLSTLFPPPQFTTQFLAMGCLFGKFSPSPPNENQGVYLVRGTLQLNQVFYLDVAIKSKVWLKLSQTQTFNPDNAYLWRVYFRTTPFGKLTLVELTRNVPIEGHLSLDNPPPPYTGVDQFYIRAEIRYTDDEKVILLLKRNQKPPQGQEQSRQWQPFLMTISSSLPSAKVGEFWDFFCTRKGEALVLTLAQRVDKTNAIQTPAQTLISLLSPTQSDSDSSLLQTSILTAHLVEKIPAVQKTALTQSNSNLSPNQVIMIQGKQAEITVKFNTRPDLPEVGKTVALFITTEQGFSVRANVNRKTLKKQVEKMETLNDWIAALSGKVARIDPNGVIELEGASVAVFEKKPKEEAVSEVEIEKKSASYVETEVEKVYGMSKITNLLALYALG